MTEVIKKNGEKQEFDPEKIKRSVEKAAREVRLSDERLKDIIVKVAQPVIVKIRDQDTIKTEDIRKEVIETVRQEAPEVAEAWKDFEQNKKTKKKEEQKEEQAQEN